MHRAIIPYWVSLSGFLFIKKSLSGGRSFVNASSHYPILVFFAKLSFFQKKAAKDPFLT